MQERPQDAAHMRIVVADEKSQLVEIDAKHGPALWAYRRDDIPALTISRRRLTKGCDFGADSLEHRAGGAGGKSVSELLAQDALFQAVAGIEQHPHRDGLVGKHLDAADIAGLVVIGDGGDRAFFALEHFDDDKGSIGEQGAAPAARAERA